jgi:hypothetical protein
MVEKVKTFFVNSKPVFKNIVFVCFIVLSLVAGFKIGSAYNEEYGPKKPTIHTIKVNRSQVNLALDEHNHLIVIDKKTGDYTVYQDSIGVSIFKLYARNIFSDVSK